MKERIEYYATLTVEQYLDEPFLERVESLSKVFLNWRPKPERTKKFVEKIIKPLEKKSKEKKDERGVNWIKKRINEDAWVVIVRYSWNYMCISTELYEEDRRKYKTWFAFNINKAPKTAKYALRLDTSDNRKNEPAFESEYWEYFKEKIYNLNK